MRLTTADKEEALDPKRVQRFFLSEQVNSPARSKVGVSFTLPRTLWNSTVEDYRQLFGDYDRQALGARLGNRVRLE